MHPSSQMPALSSSGVAQQGHVTFLRSEHMILVDTRWTELEKKQG
jgi:hypothetical protein